MSASVGGNGNPKLDQAQGLQQLQGLQEKNKPEEEIAELDKVVNGFGPSVILNSIPKNEVPESPPHLPLAFQDPRQQEVLSALKEPINQVEELPAEEGLTAEELEELAQMNDNFFELEAEKAKLENVKTKEQSYIAEQNTESVVRNEAVVKKDEFVQLKNVNRQEGLQVKAEINEMAAETENTVSELTSNLSQMSQTYEFLSIVHEDGRSVNLGTILHVEAFIINRDDSPEVRAHKFKEYETLVKHKHRAAHAAIEKPHARFNQATGEFHFPIGHNHGKKIGDKINGVPIRFLTQLSHAEANQLRAELMNDLSGLAKLIEQYSISLADLLAALKGMEEPEKERETVQLSPQAEPTSEITDLSPKQILDLQKATINWIKQNFNAGTEGLKSEREFNETMLAQFQKQIEKEFHIKKEAIKFFIKNDEGLKEMILKEKTNLMRLKEPQKLSRFNTFVNDLYETPNKTSKSKRNQT